jgi:hypothetical protein
MQARQLEIYNNVLNAMQDADEIEGIEDSKLYQELMLKIAKTALQRHDNSVDFYNLDSKINALVSYETDFLLENKAYLHDMVRDGFKGFENYTESEINKAYNDKFGE